MLKRLELSYEEKLKASEQAKNLQDSNNYKKQIVEYHQLFLQILL